MVATATGKRILIVLPFKGYNEEEFRSTRVSMRKSGIDCKVVSTSTDKAEGGIDFYYPEFTFETVNADEFDGLIFMGGEGADQIADNPKAIELARKFASNKKLVGSIGRGIASLAKAGVINGVHVTGDPALKDTVEKAGAKYSPTQIEPRWLHDNKKRVVTAYDSGASIRFGQRIVRDL